MNVILAASGAVDPSGLWSDIITFFSPDSSGAYPQVFPGLRGIVETARKPFYLIAFTLLVYYLIESFGKAERFGGGAYPIIRAAFCVGCIAFTSQLINMTSDAFNDLSATIGAEASPAQIISDMDAILLAYADMTAAENGASSSGWLDMVLHPGKALAAGMDAITQGVQMVAVCIVVGVVSALFKLAELIVLLMQCLRYLIVNLSSIFLPAMFAMVMLGALKSIGTRFVMSIIGVLAWPLAWGFGNLGTNVLLTSVAAKLDSPAPDLLSYTWVGIILLVIPMWLMVVYIGGPHLIAKTVTTGANIAQAAVAGTAASAVGVAGAAAVGAASMAGKAAATTSIGMSSTRRAGAGGSGAGGSGAGGSGAGGSGAGGSGAGGSGAGGSGASRARSGRQAGGSVGVSNRASLTAAQLEQTASVAGAGMARAIGALQEPLVEMAASEGLMQSQVLARNSLARRKRRRSR